MTMLEPDGDHECGDISASDTHTELELAEMERTLQRVQQELCALDHETVRFGVDSGAAVTIMRSDECLDYPILADGTTVKYKTANGGAVPDEGRRVLVVDTDNGPRVLRTRVGAVTKNLLSVADLVDANRTVVFDAAGSFAKNKTTGALVPFKRRNSVFETDLVVRPFSSGSPLDQINPS